MHVLEKISFERAIGLLKKNLFEFKIFEAAKSKGSVCFAWTTPNKIECLSVYHSDSKKLFFNHTSTKAFLLQIVQRISSEIKSIEMPLQLYEKVKDHGHLKKYGNQTFDFMVAPLRKFESAKADYKVEFRPDPCDTQFFKLANSFMEMFEISSASTMDVLKSPDRDFYALRVGHDIKSIAALTKVFDNSRGISFVMVDPGERKKGYAEFLLWELFNLNQNKYDSFFLNVNSNNHAAINLYRKLGFQTFHKFCRLEKFASI